MAKLQFYKGPTTEIPVDAEIGAIFFDTTKRTVNVRVADTGTSADWEAYSGVQSLSYTNQKLTWVSADGKSTTLEFSDVASKEALNALQNTVTAAVSNMSSLSGALTTVSDYISEESFLSDIRTQVTNLVASEGTVSAGLASVSNAISAMDLSLVLNEGVTISKITQVNGKITEVETKAVMDDIQFSFANNKLTISNGHDLSADVDLSILAQDKYVSSVQYLEETKDLKFTWVEKDGTTQEVTVPVGDLVDTYTAGSGIVIYNNKISIDDDLLSRVINIDSLIAEAMATANVNAQGYASSALVSAKEYTSQAVSDLETSLKAYAKALVTWAVFG